MLKSGAGKIPAGQFKIALTLISLWVCPEKPIGGEESALVIQVLEMLPMRKG